MGANGSLQPCCISEVTEKEMQATGQGGATNVLGMVGEQSEQTDAVFEQVSVDSVDRDEFTPMEMVQGRAPDAEFSCCSDLKKDRISPWSQFQEAGPELNAEWSPSTL
eukprot:Skav232906  [mRNA]  locus=scaffold1477:503231:504377:- [translate_table: standard]